MDSQSLGRQIDQFTETHFEAGFIAYVALHNFNLSDKTLHWLIDEYIPQNRAEFCSNHDVDSAEIDIVVDYLKHLLTISEDVREGILESFT